MGAGDAAHTWACGGKEPGVIAHKSRDGVGPVRRDSGGQWADSGAEIRLQRERKRGPEATNVAAFKESRDGVGPVRRDSGGQWADSGAEIRLQRERKRGPEATNVAAFKESTDGIGPVRRDSGGQWADSGAEIRLQRERKRGPEATNVAAFKDWPYGPRSVFLLACPATVLSTANHCAGSLATEWSWRMHS